MREWTWQIILRDKIQVDEYDKNGTQKSVIPYLPDSRIIRWVNSSNGKIVNVVLKDEWRPIIFKRIYSHIHEGKEKQPEYVKYYLGYQYTKNNINIKSLICIHPNGNIELTDDMRRESFP